MADPQARYDEAMQDFSRGDYAAAVSKFEAILTEDPQHFDARLALGMACSRQGDQRRAIVEGHKAEKLRPEDPLVHTNLSLFYMKAGDKPTAEHHGLRARVAAWKSNAHLPADRSPAEPGLSLAAPRPPNVLLPEKFPDMPWKKKPAPPGPASPS